MATQMQFDFMSDGPVNSPQKVEPTTGNEIPPGSSSEEVSDDIETEIPVGGYVVPADVLQYFGRKFFLDLIQKYKEEFGNADSNL
jgi:hypothetical protein